MRRITSTVLVVLVAFGAFSVADALGPESVPVADTVELHGEVPENGPPPSGFFIVPPRVIDMRDDETPSRLEDEADDDGDVSDGRDQGADDSRDTDDADDADESDDGADESADDADDSDDAADTDESDDDGDDADD